MNKKFTFHKDTKLEPFSEGATRRILAHSKTIMAVEITFKTGAAVPTHAHPHEQITYIISGAFSFENGGETKVVRAGDSVLFAPNVVHGAACVEGGKLLDVFTPCREDFLKG